LASRGNAIEILIRDERPGEAAEPVLTLQMSAPTITARDLIAARVRLEAERLEEECARGDGEALIRHAAAGAAMRGFLVVPSEPERQLNGDRGAYGPGTRALGLPGESGAPPRICAEAMVETALAAFRAGRFFLIVGERQVEGLDEALDLSRTADVTFLKITPLQGG